MNLPYPYSFAAEAMGQLKAYGWPGNVRELQNVIERALIVSRGEPLRFPDLSASGSNAGNKAPVTEISRFPPLKEMMSAHIKKSLYLSRGRIEGKGGAAELLGLNPSILRTKMRNLGIKISRTTY